MDRRGTVRSHLRRGCPQEASENEGKAIYVVVYNALAQGRDETIPLPVNTASRYVVERLGPDGGWSAVAASLVPHPHRAGVAGAAAFALRFRARGLPPLVPRAPGTTHTTVGAVAAVGNATR